MEYKKKKIKTTKNCSRYYLGNIYCPYEYTSCKKCPNFKKFVK